MSLLDIVGGLMGGGQGGGGQADLLKVVVGMLGNNNSPMGGLGGLVGQLQKSGLGDVVGSWVGTGENMPVSADQLKNALPADVLGGLLSQLGGGAGGAAPSQGDLLGQLAQMLPGVVDKLTPQGQVPTGGLGNIGDILGMLTKR
jgi:uncharacterized protein YidB (DUF937 family)